MDFCHQTEASHHFLVQLSHWAAFGVARKAPVLKPLILVSMEYQETSGPILFLGDLLQFTKPYNAIECCVLYLIDHTIIRSHPMSHTISSKKAKRRVVPAAGCQPPEPTDLDPKS